MDRLPDADPHPDAADRPALLPGGLAEPEPAPTRRGRGPRGWSRVLAGVLAVAVGAGVLVAGIVTLVTRIGVDDAATTPTSQESGAAQQDATADEDDPAYAGLVAEVEAFARSLDGVSDGDAAVVVEVVGDPGDGTPHGTVDVFLDAAGEGRMAEIAAALTDWADDAEAAGRITLDVRLSTTDGAIDLSRPASVNVERLAVAAEVVRDDAVAGFWIGASRVDLVLVAGADQGEGLQRWTARVGEIAPTMAVAVRAGATD